MDFFVIFRPLSCDVKNAEIRVSVKRYNSRCKEETLQNELQELDDKICDGGFFDQRLLDNYEALKKN